jgi:uncharacterized protein (DUF1697 family)
MTKYVALLRGIAPMNPNMRNEKLRGVFENLGFLNVKTVISSGNVLFESPEKDSAKLEALIEKALPEQLGFTSSTIIRSENELQALLDKNPYKKVEHTLQTNLNVTFLKNPASKKPDLPNGRGYEVVALYDREICTVIDLTTGKTPDLMVQLERQLGKEITTRTWKTVQRILKAMG